MNIGNITSDNFNLDGNGKDIQIEVYEQLIEQLQQENQELKLELSGYRQAILEDKDMLGLKEESEELKKQLTTYKILHRDCKVDNLKNISKIEEMENQQKEFIEYLKDKLRIANEVLDEPEEDEEARGYVLTRKFMLEEILSKYQEIMGVINNYVKDKR